MGGQLGQEDEASGFPTWRQHDQALNGESLAPTPEPYHSVYARVFNSSSPRRSTLTYSVWVQLTIPSARTSSAGQDPPEIGKTDHSNLLLGWCQLSPLWGNKLYTPP